LHTNKPEFLKLLRNKVPEENVQDVLSTIQYEKEVY
jgi:hypothetical protein